MPVVRLFRSNYFASVFQFIFSAAKISLKAEALVSNLLNKLKKNKEAKVKNEPKTL